VHEVAAVDGAEVHDEVPTSQLYSVQKSVFEVQALAIEDGVDEH